MIDDKYPDRGVGVGGLLTEDAAGKSLLHSLHGVTAETTKGFLKHIKIWEFCHFSISLQVTIQKPHGSFLFFCLKNEK